LRDGAFAGKASRVPPPKVRAAPSSRLRIKHDRAAFKRILLKLSGEVLMGDGGSRSIPRPPRASPARLPTPRMPGFELCVVVGGGNIFRGISAQPRASSAPPPIIWACSRP
jgi:hypothetical protein